jgi:hypothetical protein
MRRRSGSRHSRLLAGLLALGLVMSTTVALDAGAAEPESGTLTAPDIGTAELEYEGEVPPGTGGVDYSACQDDVNADTFHLTVVLPEPWGPTRTGQLNVEVVWAPTSPDAATSDLALFVEEPDGDVVSSDGGTPSEAVAIVDPEAGEYLIVMCAFANAAPQPYEAEVGLTVSAPTPNPPSTPSRFRFSPITTVDPQRDVAEPSLRIDPQGNEYTCGPFGSSRNADYAQKSEDGGDTFRVMGQPPEGRISPGGGGDCELAVNPVPNDQGFHNLAYTGLESLLNFSTGRSTNAGRSWVGTTASESPVVVDRQWMDAAGKGIVYLTYRQVPSGSFVQRSTDGGLTYAPPTGVAIPEISISGNLVVDERDGKRLYIAYTVGNEVRLAISNDGGATNPWRNFLVAEAEGDPSSLFPVVAQDHAGNLYVAWIEAGSYNAFYAYSTDRGRTWSQKIQVNRDQVNTTVMPWIDAGDAGRIAISFYGTEVEGNPEVGSFRGPWDVYVNTSLDALQPNPPISQTKATTHPIHWDSICLSGLACSLNGGDRTLLDFFQLRHDRHGLIKVVFNESNKESGDEFGPIAIVTYAKQINGPGLHEEPSPSDTRPRLTDRRTDPVGDGVFPFSVFPSPEPPPAGFRVEYPAMDFERVQVGPGAPGTVRFAMEVADLSAAQIQAAQAGMASPNLLWVARFFSGYTAHAAVVSYDDANGFQFGYTDLSLSADGRLETYPPSTPVAGHVNQNTGVMTVDVPISMIPHVTVATPPSAPPEERASVPGDRIFEITGFSFGNNSPDPFTQLFLNQGDVTPPFDALLPAS